MEFYKTQNPTKELSFKKEVEKVEPTPVFGTTFGTSCKCQDFDSGAMVALDMKCMKEKFEFCSIARFRNHKY